MRINMQINMRINMQINMQINMEINMQINILSKCYIEFWRCVKNQYLFAKSIVCNQYGMLRAVSGPTLEQGAPGGQTHRGATQEAASCVTGCHSVTWIPGKVWHARQCHVLGAGHAALAQEVGRFGKGCTEVALSQCHVPSCCAQCCIPTKVAVMLTTYPGSCEVEQNFSLVEMFTAKRKAKTTECHVRTHSSIWRRFRVMHESFTGSRC